MTVPAAAPGLPAAPARRRVAAATAAAAVACWSLWTLHTQFGGTALEAVYGAFVSQPLSHVAAAIGLTAASFACLGVYDLLGVRAVAGARVPARAALLAGFAANAFSNTLGLHAITGSVVRARVYGRFGLTPAEIARTVALAWLALGLGFATMVALAELAPQSLGARHHGSALLGATLVAGLAAFAAWLSQRPRTLSLFGFTQPLPSARMATALMLVGALESAAAVGALYVLLPPDVTLPFDAFAVGCIGAVLLGLVAHAPGGIGVFEAAVTAMLGGGGRVDLLAALLLYRAVYNALPFLLAAGTLGVLSVARRAKPQLDAG